MKLSAALEYEKLREDANSWNKVILHRDGKFYHAYDWSAWLIKQYVCTEEFQQQRGDEKLLQVNRYPSKNGEYAMLGFPLDSISKYIPAYEDARKMEDSDDMEITVSIDFGVLSHYDSFNIRCELFIKAHFLRYGSFDRDMTTFTLSKPTTDIAA